MDSIINFDDKINDLKENDKESYKLFKAIFDFSSASGTMKIPSTFREKVKLYFGNKDTEGNITESVDEVIERIKDQKIVKTYNKWTGSGSLFNSLRANRPGMKKEEIYDEKKKVEEYIQKSKEGCDFCEPEIYTPEDVFGRIKSKHSITGANIAKYDAWSSIIFFNKHNPLDFSQEELSDYLDTGFKWFKKVKNHDKRFKYPFFLWNCLPKAGASQVHGHAQILMTDSSPYAKIRFLRKILREYMRLTGRNYFRDLYRVHKALELALESDIMGFASITPLKEKEFVIISYKDPSKDEELKKAIYRVLRCYIDKLGISSFNLAISCPAPGETMYPYIVQIVDRGNIFKSTADMGAMELYGSSVIADDPYKVINAVNEYNVP